MSSTILTADPAGEELPGHKELPESDGSAMPNMQQPAQTDMLNQCLVPVLRKIHPDKQFCVAGDCFIYFKYTQPVLAGCKAPDWFYVPGVPPMLDGEIRRSYVLWKEGVRPLIVMEYVSGDGSEEHDTTPNAGKFWVYERAIGAAFYVIFDPQQSSLEVYQLVNGRYQPMAPNEHGRYLIEPMQVELGVWEGTFHDLTGAWLRGWDPATGKMLELVEERLEMAEGDLEASRERVEAVEASLEETRELLTEQGNKTEAERKRADEEKKRADEEKKRNAVLAAKLRELGLEPDDLTAS
jgi:Uma2 family endonuclease